MSTLELIILFGNTDYVGNLILSNGCPTKYLFDGGYYVLPRMSIAQRFAPASFGNIDIGGAPEGGNFHFFNYDHLGNVREVVGDDGTLEQVNNYYPFGAPFTDNATSAKNPDLQPYKYTGKELDLTHGLNTYYYDDRNYYPLIGVWTSMDSLSEKQYNTSPYTYCLNNPINYIDKDGKFPWRFAAEWARQLYNFTHFNVYVPKEAIHYNGERGKYSYSFDVLSGDFDQFHGIKIEGNYIFPKEYSKAFEYVGYAGSIAKSIGKFASWAGAQGKIVELGLISGGEMAEITGKIGSIVVDFLNGDFGNNLKDAAFDATSAFTTYLLSKWCKSIGSSEIGMDALYLVKNWFDDTLKYIIDKVSENYENK